MQPKVMLFDEVTSALDPELVGEVLSVLADIAHHTEMTMLLVTHEMRFAEETADHVLMFDAGRIVQDRPPHAMFSAPREERTKAFLQALLRECRPPSPTPVPPGSGRRSATRSPFLAGSHCSSPPTPPPRPCPPSRPAPRGSTPP